MSVFRNLKSVWDKFIKTNQATQKASESQPASVAAVRAADAQQSLNRSHRVVRSGGSSLFRSYTVERASTPPTGRVATLQPARATGAVPPSGVVRSSTPIEKVSVTSSQQPLVGRAAALSPAQSTAPVKPLVEEDEKLKPTFRASSEYRILPDQIDRVKETIAESLKSVKKVGEDFFTFDLEIGKPVYVDVNEFTGQTFFLSKPTDFQLFTSPSDSGNFQFYSFPIQEDGTIDKPKAITLLRNAYGMNLETAKSVLETAQPVKAFSGITNFFTNESVPVLPLTVSPLEKGKPIYFNPVTGEFTTEETLFKVVDSQDDSEPFKIVPITSPEPQFIAGNEVERVLRQYVDISHQINQTMEVISESGNPTSSYDVSSDYAVDVTKALTPYNPLDVHSGKPEVSTVQILNKDGELQPLEIASDISSENFGGRAFQFLWRLLISFGDVPERILTTTPVVAGQRNTSNFFGRLTTAFETGLSKLFRGVAQLGSEVLEWQFENQLRSVERQISQVPRALYIPAGLGQDVYESRLRRLEAKKAETEATLSIIRAQQERWEVLNRREAILSEMRNIQAFNSSLTMSGFMEIVGKASESGNYSDLETTTDSFGRRLVRKKGDKFYSSYENFFKNDPLYKDAVEKYGVQGANSLFFMMLKNPEGVQEIAEGYKIQREIQDAVNFISKVIPLAKDKNVSSALTFVNYVNMLSNPYELKKGLDNFMENKQANTNLEVVNQFLDSSLAFGQEVSQEQVDDILDFLYSENGSLNHEKYLDVAKRLAEIKNPTINDLYLIVRELEPLYYAYTYQSMQNFSSAYPSVQPYPIDFESYFEDLHSAATSAYQDVMAYAMNLRRLAQLNHEVGNADLAETFSQDAFNVILGSVQFDRIVRATSSMDVYGSWSWEVAPDSYLRFMKNIALSVHQLGRPLTPNEITDIRDNTVDIAYIMAGQMVADVSNLFSLGIFADGLKHSAAFLGKSLKAIPVVSKSLDAIAKTKFVRFFADLSLRSSIQKNSYQIGEFFVRSLGDGLFEPVNASSTTSRAEEILDEAIRALIQSREAQIGDADDMLENAVQIFRQKEKAMKFIPSYVTDRDLKAFFKSVDFFVDSEMKSLMKEGVVDVLTSANANLISKNITDTLSKAMFSSIEQFNQEVEQITLNRLKDRRHLNKYRSAILEAMSKADPSLDVKKVTDDQIVDFLEKVITKVDVASRMDDLQGLLYDAVKSQVLQDISKNRQFVHFLFSVSDTFVQYGRNLNRAWKGTTLLSDELLGVVGNKFPIAKPVVRLAGEALNLFMGLWVTATLARRPAWVVFNQMENLFRFITLSIFNPTEYKQMIFGLIPDSSRAKILAELGVVPSGIGIDFLPVQTIVDEERFARYFKGVSIASLSENPFKFFSSHYARNFKEIVARQGIANKIFAPYTALVSSIQSFNQVIEYGMRLRVYHTLLKRSMRSALPFLLDALAKDFDMTIQKTRAELRSELLSQGSSEVIVERVLDEFDNLMYSYSRFLSEGLQISLTDPFRVLSLVANSSSERLRGLISLYADNFKIGKDFYSKTRLVHGDVTNLNKIIELVSAKLNDAIVASGDSLTEETIRGVIASIRADFETSVGEMYNIKIRTLFQEAVSDSQTSGVGRRTKKSTSKVSVISDSDAAGSPPDKATSPLTPNPTDDVSLRDDDDLLVVFSQQVPSDENKDNPLSRVSKIVNDLRAVLFDSNSNEKKVADKIIKNIEKSVVSGKNVPKRIENLPVEKIAEREEALAKQFEQFIFETVSESPTIQELVRGVPPSELDKIIRDRVIPKMVAEHVNNSIAGVVSSNGFFGTLLDVFLRHPITGLWNKQAFDYYYLNALKKQAKIAMIDLRGLHATNNLSITIGGVNFSGYAVGDAYLKYVADNLSKISYRGSTMPAFAVGGDEFIVLFPPDADDAELVSILNQVAQSVNSGKIPVTFDVPINGIEEKVTLPFEGATMHFGIGKTKDAAQSGEVAQRQIWLKKMIDEGKLTNGRSYSLSLSGDVKTVPVSGNQSLEVSVVATEVVSDAEQKLIAENRKLQKQLEAKTKELQKVIAEKEKLEQQVEQQAGVISRNTEALNRNAEVMRNLDTTIENLNATISRLAGVLEKREGGNVVYVIPDGADGVRVVGTVPDEDSAKVAKAVDDVLRKQNSVEEVTEPLKVTEPSVEPPVKVVPDIPSKPIEGIVPVPKEEVRIFRKEMVKFRFITDLSPKALWKFALETKSPEITELALRNSNAQTLYDVFSKDASAFLNHLQTIRDGISSFSDASQVYASLGLMKYLKDTFIREMSFQVSALPAGDVRKFILELFASDSGSVNRFLKGFQSEFKEIVERVISSKDFGKVWAGVNPDLIELYSGIGFGTSFDKALSQFLDDSVKDVTFSNAFKEALIDLQFNPDVIQVLQNEKLFGGLYKEVIRDLAKRNFDELSSKSIAEIISSYESTYVHTLQQMLRFGGVSYDHFLLFLDAFDTFIARVNRIYGDQPLIRFLYDALLSHASDVDAKNYERLANSLGIVLREAKPKRAIHASWVGLVSIFNETFSSRNDDFVTAISSVLSKFRGFGNAVSKGAGTTRIRIVGENADEIIETSGKLTVRQLVDDFLNENPKLFDVGSLQSGIFTTAKTYTTEEGEKKLATKTSRWIVDDLVLDENGQAVFNNNHLYRGIERALGIFRKKFADYLNERLSKEGVLDESKLKQLSNFVMSPKNFSHKTVPIDSLFKVAERMQSDAIFTEKVSVVSLPRKIMNNAKVAADGTIEVTPHTLESVSEVFENDYYRQPLQSSPFSIARTKVTVTKKVTASQANLEELKDAVGEELSGVLDEVSGDVEQVVTSPAVKADYTEPRPPDVQPEFEEPVRGVALETEEPQPLEVGKVEIGSEESAQPVTIPPNALASPTKSKEFDMEEFSSEIEGEVERILEVLKADVDRYNNPSGSLVGVSVPINIHTRLIDNYETSLNIYNGIFEELTGKNSEQVKALLAELVMTTAAKRKILDPLYLKDVFGEKFGSFRPDRFVRITRHLFDLDKSPAKVLEKYMIKSPDALDLDKSLQLWLSYFISDSFNAELVNKVLSNLSFFSKSDLDLRTEFVRALIKKGKAFGAKNLANLTSIRVLDENAPITWFSTLRANKLPLMSYLSVSKKTLSQPYLVEVFLNDYSKEVMGEVPQRFANFLNKSLFNPIRENLSNSIDVEITRYLIGKVAEVTPNRAFSDENVLSIVRTQLAEILVNPKKMLSEDLAVLIDRSFDGVVMKVLNSDEVGRILRKNLRGYANSEEVRQKFISWLKDKYTGMISDYFEGLKGVLGAGDIESATDAAQAIIERSALSGVPFERDKELLELLSLSSLEELRLKELAFNSSEEFKSLVSSQLRNVYGGSGKLSEYDVRQIAFATQDVLDKLSAKEKEAYDKLVESLRSMVAFRKASKITNVSDLAGSIFADVANRMSRLKTGDTNWSDVVFKALRPVLGEGTQHTSYSSSLEKLQTSFNRVISFFTDTNFDEIAGKFTEAQQQSFYSSLNEVGAYIENMVIRTSTLMSAMSENTRNVFPAPLLMRGGADSESPLYGDIKNLFTEVFGVEETSVGGLAWEDWFWRMTNLNNMMSDKMNTLNDLLVRFLDDVKKNPEASDELMSKILVSWRPPTMREVLKSYGLDFDFTKSSGKFRNAPVVTITFKTGSGSKVVSLDPTQFSRRPKSSYQYLYSSLQVLFFGSQSTLEEKQKLLDSIPAFDYIEKVFTAFEEKITKKYVTSPVPIVSLDFLLSADLTKMPNSDTLIRLKKEILAFQNTSVSIEKLETEFGKVLTTLSEIYRIPTTVLRDNQTITTYDKFLGIVRESLRILLSDPEFSPLESASRKRILDFLDASFGRGTDRNKLKVFLNSLTEINSGAPFRRELLNTIITALNFHHVSITNQPFSKLIAGLAGKGGIGLGMSSIITKTLTTNYGMNYKQAKQAYQFTRDILARLWKMNNEAVDLSTVSDADLWGFVFEMFAAGNSQHPSVLSLGKLYYTSPHTPNAKLQGFLLQSLNPIFMHLTRGEQDFGSVMLTKDNLENLKQVIRFFTRRKDIKIRFSNSEDFSLKVAEALTTGIGKEFSDAELNLVVNNMVNTIDGFIKQMKKSDFGTRQVSLKNLIDSLTVGIYPIEVSQLEDGYKVVLHKSLSEMSPTANLKATFSLRESKDGLLDFVVRLSSLGGRGDKRTVINSTMLAELKNFFSNNGFTKLEWDETIFVEGVERSVQTLSGKLFSEFADAEYGVTRFVSDADGVIKAIITSFQNASASTFLHEFYHAIEDFIPPAARYQLYDEAFQFLKKGALQTPEVINHKNFFEFAQEFGRLMEESSKAGVDSEIYRLRQEYIDAFVSIKEHTVSAFEYLILNKLSTATDLNSPFTSEFAKQFKDVLLISYAKVRQNLAYAKANGNLVKTLDKLLFASEMSELSAFKVKDEEAISSMFKNLYKILYTQKTSTSLQQKVAGETFLRRLLKESSEVGEFKTWNVRQAAKFWQVNDTLFANLVETGRMFNPASISTILPKQMFSTVGDFHVALVDYSLFPLLYRHKIFEVANPYEVYRALPLKERAVLDYLGVLFHEPDIRYFNPELLSYDVSSFIDDLQNDVVLFNNVFGKVKDKLEFLIKNFNYLSEGRRLSAIETLITDANKSFLTATDIAGVEFTPRYQELVSRYKKSLGDTPLTPQKVVEDLQNGNKTLTTLQNYVAEIFNPKFKSFDNTSRYWQTKVYLDYLPDNLRTLVNLGNPVAVFNKGDVVLKVSDLGTLDTVLTSDVTMTSNLHKKYPLLYVSKKLDLEIPVEHISELTGLDSVESIVEYLVRKDLSEYGIPARALISQYVSALGGIPEDKINLISKVYSAFTSDLFMKVPDDWLEQSPEIKAGLNVLQKIDREKNPEQYAKVLGTLRKISFQQMTNTQYTYDRMLSLLDTISSQWWHKVNSFLPAGVKREDAIHILRKAIEFELTGLEPSEALKRSLRTYVTGQWLKNNFGSIRFNVQGSGKTISLILDDSSLISIRDIMDERFPASVLKDISGKSLEELRNSNFDVFYDVGNKIFKPDVLNLDNVLDNIEGAYLVTFGSSIIPDRTLQMAVEQDFVSAIREELGDSAYLVRLSSNEYVVLSTDATSQVVMSKLWRDFSSSTSKGIGDKPYPYRISVKRYSMDDVRNYAMEAEARKYSFPFHPKPRVLSIPQTSFTYNGFDFDIVTRSLSDESAFVLSKTDGANGTPVYGLLRESFGDSRTFQSMNIREIFAELDIPFTETDLERLRQYCKFALGSDNFLDGLNRAWIEFSKFVDATDSLPPSAPVFGRLSEIFSYLFKSGKIVDNQNSFIDYILATFAFDYRDISRASLPDGRVFYFLPSELVIVPDALDWKPTPPINRYFKDMVTQDASLNRQAGILDSDLQAIADSKMLGSVLGTPIDNRPSPIGFYQSVSSRSVKDRAWGTFTRTKLFPIEREGVTELVSLRDIMSVFDPDDYIYEGVDRFIDTMNIFLKKLGDNPENVHFAELVNYLIGLAEEFKKLKLTKMEKYSKEVEKLLPTINQFYSKVPTNLNLVFDWDVWKMVSDSLFVGFDLHGMKSTLDMFENILVDELKKGSVYFDMARRLSPDYAATPESKALSEMYEQLSKRLNEVWSAVNYGGKVLDDTLDVEKGVINEMNRIMIDYFSTTQADEWMKMIVPFWMYPSRSLPYWLDLIIQHPELMTFYTKYRRWSDNINWQDGGVTSDGRILPSLKGYIPLTMGVYFNPLAPFMFRFVAPEIRDVPETRPKEDMGLFQNLAKLMLDIVPQYGFAVSPVFQAVLMSFYDPYYPRSGLSYELVRSVLPIEWIPPVLERTLVEYTRKITRTDMPDLWKPEVSWMDYLVEQEILSTALARINQADTDEKKREIAKWASDIIMDANRQSNPEWIEFEDRIRNSDYGRYMLGNLTGIYTKTLSPLRGDLLAMRLKALQMREAINDATKSFVFDMSDTPANLYKKYNEYRFDTPEGNIHQLYQTVRYVINPDTGKFATGDERLQLMLEDYQAEQATQLYYQAIEEENRRYEKELNTLRIGDVEGRKKIREEHFARLAEIRTNPAFEKARRTKFLSPIKPADVIYEDVYNDWWFLLTSDEPKFSDYSDYDSYMQAKEEWLADLSNTAKILYPIYLTTVLAKAIEQELPDEAIQRYKESIEKVFKSTSAEQYEQFRNSSKTVIDAVWDAYQKLYIDPYYEALRGKTGYEYELAQMEYFATHPAPNQDEMVAWVKEKFGDKFTEDEIRQVFTNNKPYTIPEKEEVFTSQIEKDAKDALRILQNAGNQSSELFKRFKQAYIALGGKESDFDIIWATGGDAGNFANSERFYEIYKRMKQAAQLAKVPERLTADELRERIEVQKLNDVFRTIVERELGTEFYALLNYYYSLSDSEQREFRNKNKEEYAKIQRYYRMRDDYSSLHPLWASYYNPNFSKTSAEGGGSSSGGSGRSRSYSGGGYGGGSSFGGYRQPTSILRMGKRSTLDAMRLLLDGVLGSGGAEKQPLLTPELVELIGERAAREIEEGRADNDTAKYLDKLAKVRPDKSDELKKLAQKIRRGGDLSYVRGINKFQ